MLKPISEFLWQPILESAAQTITGMIGGYILKNISSKTFEKNRFLGVQDLWYKGIMRENFQPDDTVVVDGLLSTYSQVFPGNPFKNAKRWDSIYNVEGKIDKYALQAMDFAAGSDTALRIDPFNGETLVGIYNQYGYIGEGMVGVVATSILKKTLPDFNNPNFIGHRALIGGKLKKCPAQHAFVIESISRKYNLDIDASGYKNLVYLNIEWIKPYRKNKNIFTLLGSPWAVTTEKTRQYILRYGHFSEPKEIENCLKSMKKEKAWKKVKVFFDELLSPTKEINFKKVFLKI